MSRLSYSIKNAKVSMFFYLVMIVLNFVSRRVFIDSMGNDLVGLTATVVSYIGMLNLAEMGISAAIAAVLYAPLFSDNRERINEIISIYGYLFQRIGAIIFAAGVVMSLFLPLIFGNDGLEMLTVYLAFYTFLIVTTLSYVVNYKQNLLIANQKNYIVATILNVTSIAKTVAQIVMLLYFNGGFEMWLALEIVAAVSFAIWLDRRLKREYPWLKSNVRQGRAMMRHNPEIVRNIKQVFSHKIASFVLQQTDTIMIQMLLGVRWVTFFTNYAFIGQRATQLIVGTFASNTAGVGNLVAEGDLAKTKLVFGQLNAMFFWIGGVVAFGYFNFVSPFIALWLPTSELFSTWVVALFAFNIFVYIVRQPVIYFVGGYGIFGDTASAWIEAGLNLGLSIVLGLQYGIIGIVGGTSISTILIVMIWRPHYLSTRGFGDRSGLGYWLMTLKYGVVLGLVWFAALQFEPIWDLASWRGLILNAAVLIPMTALLYGAGMYAVSSSMRSFVKLSFKLITDRFGVKKQ